MQWQWLRPSCAVKGANKPLQGRAMMPPAPGLNWSSLPGRRVRPTLEAA